MHSIFRFIIFLTVAPAVAFSQNKITLVLKSLDAVSLPKKFSLKTEYANVDELNRALQSLVLKLQGNGYIEASVDSQQTQGDTLFAYLHTGRQYEWAALSSGNVEDELLQQIGFKEKFYSGTTFNYKSAETLLQKVVTYHENNGYPFAQVQLDSITIEDDKIAAALFLVRRQMIQYDTVAVHGDSRVSKKFLYSYLNIKPKGLYNESVIRKVNKRLSTLAFLQVEKPMQVLFQGEQAKLHLYLKNKKASRFDFLLGVLPNNAQTGKVLITGEILLDLLSPFGRGEQFFLNWKRLQARTQSLDVAFKFPYLFSTPIGIDLGFNLYKHDTLYLDLDWDIGFQYLFAGGNYFKAFVHNKMTNVLNVDTNAIVNSRKLPAMNDVRNTLFGVEYFQENLDYRLNPKRGYSVQVKAAAGTRKIKELSEVTGLNDPENPGSTFESLYDSVDLKTVQYKFDYRLDKFWQIGKRSTMKTALRGGAIISDNIFQNELYRIGGSRMLRGFDEEAIFASLFNVVTLEYRFLLSKNSYFNLFYDAAYVENRADGYENDFPFGFGAGLAFETKAGLFGVSYALGRQQSAPIDFRAAKIHFGYVSYF